MRSALIYGMFTLHALAGKAEPEQVSIAVNLYNYAAVPDHDLLVAKREVFRIFQDAGIHTKVAECPLSAAEVGRYQECDQASHPVQVMIHLRPGFPSRELAKSGDVFGLAFLPEDGRLGVYAHVYTGGAAILARRTKSLEPRMLGHLIAHEIGHLLLATKSHSVDGVMRAEWREIEKDRAAQGRLLFLKEDARTMRANAAGLLRQEMRRTPDAKSGIR